MDKLEKIQFVEDVFNSLKNEIREKIAKEKIPTTWDGRHLREYIEQKVRENLNYRSSKEIKKEVENEIIVNNI